MKKSYETDELIVNWQPDTCSHSTVCWKEATGLPLVFNPSKRPWVEITGSSTDRIIEQIKKCPSGALSYVDKRGDAPSNPVQDKSIPTVSVSPNGPLIINGTILITDVNGHTTTVTKTALCRCGASNKKPYCDGSHNSIGFNDRERKD